MSPPARARHAKASQGRAQKGKRGGLWDNRRCTGYEEERFCAVARVGPNGVEQDSVGGGPTCEANSVQCPVRKTVTILIDGRNLKWSLEVLRDTAVYDHVE